MLGYAGKFFRIAIFHFHDWMQLILNNFCIVIKNGQPYRLKACKKFRKKFRCITKNSIFCNDIDYFCCSHAKGICTLKKSLVHLK